MFNYVTSTINIYTSLYLINLPLLVLYLTKNKHIEVTNCSDFIWVDVHIIFANTRPRTAANLINDAAISIVRIYMITDLYKLKLNFTYKSINLIPRGVQPIYIFSS